MKKINKKLGFTLIELLVVITIIGILATGAVNVFTTQLQGARDSTRITDMKVTEVAVQQYYVDNDNYPDDSASGTFLTAIRQYVSKDIADPKGTNICINSATTRTRLCAGYYGRGADSFGLANNAFKISVAFEKEGNKGKMSGDGDGTGSGQFLYDLYGGGTGGLLNTPTMLMY